MNDEEMHRLNVKHALNNSDVVEYTCEDEVASLTTKLTLLRKAHSSATSGYEKVIKGLCEELEFTKAYRDYPLDIISDLYKGRTFLLNSNLLQRIKFVFTGVKLSDEYLKYHTTESYKDN